MKLATRKGPIDYTNPTSSVETLVLSMHTYVMAICQKILLKRILGSILAPQLQPQYTLDNILHTTL